MTKALNTPENAPKSTKQKVLSIVKNTLRFAAIAAVWLALWQFAHMLVRKSILLPSPAETLAALVRLSGTGELWSAVGSSLLRIMAGYLSGMVFGCLLAVVTSFSRLLKDFLHPLMVIMKTTPVASFIILAVVWLKSANVPAFTVALIVAPIFWSNIYTGIFATDKKLIEMAKMFRFSRRSMITKLYIPSVMPYFHSAMTVGIGMAWKAGVAAEVICNPGNSIGSGLYDSKIYLETDTMFAWTVMVIILSIILEKAVVSILNRTLGRRFSYDKA